MEKIVNKLGKIKTSNAFVNASFVYILANGLGQGTTLFVNTFFTRYMSQSDYGLYSNYYSLVAILVPVVGANLYDGLAVAYMDYREKIYEFRSSLLLLFILWGGFASFILLAFKFFFDWKMPLLCVILALIHACGFFAINYYLQSMNMENQYIKKGIGLCVPNLLQALLGVAAVILYNNYISRAVGSTVGVAICGMAGIVIICRDAKPRYNAEYWKYALRISLPAIISSISAMIMQQCDKMMITEFLNSEVTAVYSLTYNIGYILYAVQQATGGVWQVWYYNTLENKNYNNVPIVQKWYMFVMFVLATGLYMVSPEVIKFLSPETYWEFDYVIPFIIGSYLMLMYSLHLSTVQYNKKTGVVSGIVSFAAIVNIMFNYIMIPCFGGIAAAYTSVFSYFLIFVVGGVYLVIKKQYYFKGKYFGFFGVGIVLMGLIFYFTKDLLMVRYGVFMIIILTEAVYMYLKRKNLKDLLAGNQR